MEMEGTIKPSPLPKKLSKMLRVLLIMLKKGISKTKLTFDLHLTLKRGNKLAGKAITNLLMLHHHHRSPSNNTFPSSFKNDEFPQFTSRSSTPNYYQQLFFHSATTNLPHHRTASGIHNTNIQLEEDAATVAAVQRVLEMLDNNNDVGQISPLVNNTYTLPAVRGGRQLRITDSPFPLEDGGNIHEDSVKVNEAADEFIMKFYSNLMKQTPS